MPTINLGKRRKSVRTVKIGQYQKIYQDKRWWKLREWKLWNNPLCEDCEKEGKVIPAEEVHHIVPFDRGKTKEEIEELAFNYNNLMSLCVPHHKKRHRELNK